MKNPLQKGGGSEHDVAQDRRLVSEESHEINYVIGQLSEQFPQHEHGDLRRIVTEAKRIIQPSESRERLMEEARRLLREQKY